MTLPCQACAFLKITSASNPTRRANIDPVSGFTVDIDLAATIQRASGWSFDYRMTSWEAASWRFSIICTALRQLAASLNQG